MNTPFCLLAAVFLLSSCKHSPSHPKDPREVSIDKYQVKVIDGCEYLEYSYFMYSQVGLYSLTHKGNCTNPIHYVPTLPN